MVWQGYARGGGGERDGDVGKGRWEGGLRIGVSRCFWLWVTCGCIGEGGGCAGRMGIGAFQAIVRCRGWWG